MLYATLATSLRTYIIFLKRSIVEIENNSFNTQSVISPRVCFSLDFI